MKKLEVGGRIWRFACAALLVVACGGAVGQPTAGGESHFLRQCKLSCGEGLECVSGVCSRPCLVDKDSCADLAPRATCTDASIEPGAVAVCDLACDDRAACASLGAGYECDAGFCRGAILPGQTPLPEPSGDAGAANAGAGGGHDCSQGCDPLPEPWQPPALCALTFDADLCDANIRMFAAVDGHCTEVGCETSENGFSTLEECLAVCEGRPSHNPCPEGRVLQDICIACGVAGGCAKTIEACARPCETSEDCRPNQLDCGQGVCQLWGSCI